MTSDNDFLLTIVKISQLIRQKSIVKSQSKISTKDRPISTFLIEEVFQDFRYAQDLILENLILREQKLVINKKKLKTTKTNTEEYQLIKEEVQDILFQQNIFRKLADSIAWIMIGGQNYIARRLYLDVNPPVLTNSNIKSVKEIADECNMRDPQSFTLISDLTSFIQVGDLLRISKKGLTIIEVKEGIANHKSLEISNYISIENQVNGFTKLPLQISPKLKSQVLRILRQKDRMNRALTVINNDKGLDTRTDLPVRVFNSRIHFKYYNDQIAKLFEELNTNNFTQTIIDDCLYILAFKDKEIDLNQTIIPYLSDHFIGKKVGMFDLWESFFSPATEPIFIKPFEDEIIQKLLTKEIIVLMFIDYDKVIEMFIENGLPMRWLTKKETAKLLKSDPYKNSIIVIDNKAFGFFNEKVQYPVGLGFNTRILSDLIKPKTVVKIFANSFLKLITSLENE